MAKLTGTVHVHRVEKNEQGREYVAETRVFGPDDKVPAEWAKLITNPAAWDGGEPPKSADAGDGDAPASADEPDGGGEPPRSGKGSSTEAWQKYAASLGVEVPEDASRDDIVAAVDAHNAA
jgi:hypothetical protein